MSGFPHPVDVNLPWTDVTYLGASGDGVTDDTSAIQEACSKSNTLVVFPPGNYLVSSTITLASGVKVLGSGYGNTNIIFTQNADVINAPNGGCSLECITIKPQSGITPTAGNCVNAGGHIFHLMQAQLTGYNGINISGGITTIFQSIISASNIGINGTSTSSTVRIISSQTQGGVNGVNFSGTFLWVYDLEINNPSGDGIVLTSGSSQVYATSSWISAAGVASGTGNGINVQSGFVGDLQLIGCQFQDFPGHGIWIQAGDGVTIANCQISASNITSNTYDGIHIDAGSNIQVSGNSVGASAYYGNTARYGLYTAVNITIDTSNVFNGVTAATGGSGTLSGSAHGGLIFTNGYFNNSGIYVNAGEISLGPGAHLNPAYAVGSIPNNPPLNFTTYQNTSGGPLEITLPVTGGSAADTAQWYLGSTASPGTWGAAETIAINEVKNLKLLVPNNWYWAINTGATIGTASVLTW